MVLGVNLDRPQPFWRDQNLVDEMPEMIRRCFDSLYRFYLPGSKLSIYAFPQ